ncbi:efflux RND transporter periplasmic adaptor subunit [Alsobacter sp. KACC 23698]|uniref:Efflux RND transporter periplasmic adaptor subunit n=1 Tax=Alsobacter sp. KACC 23698 TaxID=3149229 RepID=A0AAU7JJ63_9HYPH
MTSPPQAEPDILTAPVERGAIEQVVTMTGALQAVVTVDLGSQLPGEVSKLFVDFNDEVSQGQVLAQLDQRSYRARVDEGRAALEIAQANVRIQQARFERAQIDLQDARAQRAVLQAKLENAQVRFDAADRDVQRKLTLRARDAASVASVDESQTQLASAKAALREAQAVIALNNFAVSGAEVDVRRLEAELTQALAAVPQRQAALKVATIDLDRTTLRSPIHGVVVGRAINEGQTIAIGLEARPVFTIAQDLSEMEIHARVDETDIGKIKAGQRASFTVDAHPDMKFDALVRQVRKAPQVNQNVVTYTVVLRTNNDRGLLLPGMTALVRITVKQSDEVLKIPTAALRYSPKREASVGVPGSRAGSSVWVVQADGQLRPVPVSTGANSADQIAVLRGNLTEGDRVAVGEASKPAERRIFGVRIGF